MQWKFVQSIVLGLTGCLTCAATARGNFTDPGSMLLYPIFDNTPGTVTLLTVTNVNSNEQSGTIKVEFVYRNWDTCEEFNRTQTLTANDTFTAFTRFHNPTQTKGYAYVFAKDPITGQAISFNYLIGTNQVYDGMNGDFEVEPFVFIATPRQGFPTDVDGDHVRDLDGQEYAPVPDKLLFPMFKGNDSQLIAENLILINLTGGPMFTALLDFLVYNDNEEVFSAQYSFKCWVMAGLLQINGVFRNSFLLSTNHNPSEVQGLGLQETGWFKIDGHSASSSFVTINDPAVLAVRIQPLGPDNNARGAIQAFAWGRQMNGGLLQNGVSGD